jgi:hypothetical protein
MSFQRQRRGQAADAAADNGKPDGAGAYTGPPAAVRSAFA